MDEKLAIIQTETSRAAHELLQAAKLSPGHILVVGCSTSEVRGERIGSAGSGDVAAAILAGLQRAAQEHQVYLAIQCCEHLNRALVLEQEAADKYGLEPVVVVPVAHAGGALAAQAMAEFTQPAVVERVVAHAGIDIGSTLIGMHLKAVAVPVRLAQNKVGQAAVTAARTRPKLIGGPRAVYVRAQEQQAD